MIGTLLAAGALAIGSIGGFVAQCAPPDDGAPLVAGHYTGGDPRVGQVQYVGQEFYGPSGLVQVDTICWNGSSTVSLIAISGSPVWKANGTLWVYGYCIPEYPYYYTHYAYGWG